MAPSERRSEFRAAPEKRPIAGIRVRAARTHARNARTCARPRTPPLHLCARRARLEGATENAQTHRRSQILREDEWDRRASRLRRFKTQMGQGVLDNNSLSLYLCLSPSQFHFYRAVARNSQGTNHQTNRRRAPRFSHARVSQPTPFFSRSPVMLQPVLVAGYPQVREIRGPSVRLPTFARAAGPHVVYRRAAIFSLFAAAARQPFHLLNRPNVIGDVPRVSFGALRNTLAIGRELTL